MSSLRAQAVGAAIGLGLFTVLLCLSAAVPVDHDDVFWHLRTAQWVIEKGEVPRVDHYTHTVAGEPWTSHEWGFALLLYGPYRLGGFSALVALTAFFAVLVFAFTFLHMRRYLGPERWSIAVPLLVLGWASLLRSCLVLRAALFSSVALAALCALLERLHRTRDRRWMLPIAALIWFWANCHASVAFGLAMLGAHVLQALLDLWRMRPSAFWAAAVRGIPGERVLLLLACAGLSLVNPNGFDLWTFSFRVNALIYRSDVLWTMGQYAAPTLARYPFFFLLVAVVLAACVPLSRLRAVLADPQRPALAQGVGMLFFLVMALRANRFITDFVVMALPLCAMLWGSVAPASASTPLARLWRSPWSHVCNSVLLGLVFWVVRPSWPRDPVGASVPQALASFMLAQHVEGRMYNYENNGGYLGFRLRQPVYWDGRCDIFGDVASELVSTADFGQVFARHRVDMLVLNADEHARLRDYLGTHRSEWGLAYLDDRFALWLQRVPKFQGVLARWDYQSLAPFQLPSDAELHQVAQDPQRLARMDREAQLVLAQNPQVFLGWYVRGELARERGELRVAHAYLERAAKLIENSQVLYDLALVARDLGNEAEARLLLQRAIALTSH